jgi:hypothetical protein
MDKRLFHLSGNSCTVFVTFPMISANRDNDIASFSHPFAHWHKALIQVARHRRDNLHCTILAPGFNLLEFLSADAEPVRPNKCASIREPSLATKSEAADLSGCSKVG